MGNPPSDLTAQQSAFVREYMRDLNGEQAALRLGHDGANARDWAAKLLRETEVTKAIADELGRRMVRTASIPRVVGQVLRRERPIRSGLMFGARLAAVRCGFSMPTVSRGVQTRSMLRPEDPESGLKQAYCQGRCFYCFGDGPISHTILSGRPWDPHLKRILRNVCTKNPGGTVVEVGANIGATFLPECASYPEARFVMIEPLPVFFDILKRNVESFEARNVELHNVAVSDRRGDIVLVYDQSSGGVAAEAALLGQQRAAVVETVTLDGMFPEEDVSLLKADVDGYELDVLRGGRNLLRRSRPDVLFEFNPIAMEVRGFDASELPKTLAELGIGVFDIYSSGGDFIETTKDPARPWHLFRSLMNPLNYLDIHAKAEP